MTIPELGEYQESVWQSGRRQMGVCHAATMGWKTGRSPSSPTALRLRPPRFEPWSLVRRPDPGVFAISPPKDAILGFGPPPV